MKITLPQGPGPHILIYDIETTPIQQWRWTAGRDESRALQVDRESHLLTVAYKWLGQKKTHTLHNFGSEDDLIVVDAVWQLLDAADMVITHNGDRFDNKKVNTRFLRYGFGPPSPYQSIDTLKIARKVLAHHSHSLDALAELTATARKKEHGGIRLWFDCMAGDSKALTEMLQYNRRDVEVLEELYMELQPWATNHPNRGHWSTEAVCPNCGSGDLQKRGYKYTRTGKFQQYLCHRCGGWSRARMSEQERPQLT